MTKDCVVDIENKSVSKVPQNYGLRSRKLPSSLESISVNSDNELRKICM